MWRNINTKKFIYSGKPSEAASLKLLLCDNTNILNRVFLIER